MLAKYNGPGGDVAIPDGVTSIGGHAFMYCETHAYNNGEITAPAACAAEGVITYTCTVCGEARTESISRLDGPRKKFIGLSPTGFCLNAVAWAVTENITTGTTATFNPNGICNRGEIEIVTFLYRAYNK